MSSQINQSIIAKDVPIMLFDGESQSDSIQGAAAAILLMPNGRRYTVSQLISFTHKDEAEYTALIIGLKKAQKLGLQTLAIKGDSDLIFNQVNGLTAVQEERLIKLYRTALKLMRSFTKVSLEWISSEQNRPAKSAVKRCLEEALGREKRKHQDSLSWAIAHLIQKGEQATAEDYRQLKVPPDEWTKKSLSELRTLIPLEVRDAIALQWQGDEENLAQMYRWYLRGLPPQMACRKVNLARLVDSTANHKLPWEEALNLPPQTPSSTSDVSDPLALLISELDEGVEDAADSPTAPFLPNLLETSKQSESEDFIKTSASHRETQDSLTKNAFEALSSTLDEENIAQTPQTHQDTLPSKSSVANILNLISHLSSQEKIMLAQELVKFPEMVNLILKTIADNVSQGNPHP